MTGLNAKWAVAELDKFIAQTMMKNNSHSGNGVASVTHKPSTAASDADVARQAQLAAKIFDRVIPTWRTEIELRKTNRSPCHREAAIRVREELLREEEIRQNLGDNASLISANQLHSWFWSGARSLWLLGHYRSPVEDAAKKLNAETQNKVGRLDVSETDLFEQAFSLDAAVAGTARLRRRISDGIDTYKPVQRGAMAFAEGTYEGIRNPFNHADLKSIDEQIGLEDLAAPSFLVWWVDDVEVETAS